MAEIPFQKWRHNLRTAVNNMQQANDFIEKNSNDEVGDLLREALTQSIEQLEAIYLEVYTLQKKK